MTVVGIYWLILILGTIIGWGVTIASFIQLMLHNYALGIILFIVSLAVFAVSFLLPLTLFGRTGQR